MTRRHRQHGKRQRSGTPGSSASSTAPGASGASGAPASSTSSAPSGTGKTPASASGSAGGVILSPWWERFPGRFDQEIRSLDASGFSWERDEQHFKNGRLYISVTVPRDDGDLELEARYPDTFPYTPFEVLATSLELEHHMGPFEKNLCLLRQGDWDPSDTLGGLLETQLEEVIATGTATESEGLEDREAVQGEPISEYYSCLSGTAVLIDGSWNIPPDIHKGILELGFIRRSEESMLAALIEIRDGDSNVLGELDPQVAGLFPPSVPGRWIRSAETIIENDPIKFLARLVRIDPSLAVPKYARVRSTDSRFPETSVDIIGVVQPEEHSHRSKSDGWVFVLRGRVKTGNGLHGEIGPFLVRADRCGRNDLKLRIPELSSLSNRTVSLVGLGCIGAPSALQLARAGIGELRVLDHDRMDAGTSVRWPLGISVAGERKVDTIASFIRQNHPYTNVVEFDHRIGIVFSQPMRDREVLPRLVTNTDLLYDASADLMIQHLLSDLARDANVNYIGVNSTLGGWGGTVVRVRPNETKGCWVCLEHWHDARVIPRPPRKSGGSIQPLGCGSPTFEAASFDVETIALTGVRLAASTLSSGGSDEYPTTDWDVAIISLRDESGGLIAPKVQTFALERHPGCLNHH